MIPKKKNKISAEKLKPIKNRCFEVQLPAHLDNLEIVRRVTTDFINEVNSSVSENWLDECRLVVTEIFVNICKHSNPEFIKLQFKSSKAKLNIIISDDGKRWNPDEVDEPDLSELHVKGYGLYLIKKLSQKFHYLRKAKGSLKNVTRIEKKW